MKIRTTVVCLPIRDAAAAAAFYRKALGLKLQVEAGMVTIELPNLTLFLMEREAFEGYSRKARRAAQLPSAGATGVIVSCAMESKADVDAVLRNVPKHGGSVPGAAAVDPASGGYIGYFADPEGHLWELVYPQPR
jgi:predicted lactoylglutathione lyase